MVNDNVILKFGFYQKKNKEKRKKKKISWLSCNSFLLLHNEGGNFTVDATYGVFSLMLIGHCFAATFFMY